MKRIVLLLSVAALTLFAVAPAFGQSYVIPLDDGFVASGEGNGFESNTILSGDAVADTFEFGNVQGASVGSGFGFDDPFASYFEVGGQRGAAVGGGGYILFAGDFGSGLIDLNDLQFDEDGGAAEAQYDG